MQVANQYAQIAVIIPVYNVEKYLKECLDSVIHQSFKDLQIICVNDGSTDESVAILNEYAKKDKRITIINKTNGGLGSARNEGIKHINAKYVYFVDSDDWLEKDRLEKLYQILEDTKADICLAGLTKYIEKDKKFVVNDYTFSNVMFRDRKDEICDFRQIKAHIFSRFGAVLKFYRYDFLKTLLKDNKLYPENVLFEDVLPHAKSLLLAEKIAFSEDRGYFYRVREGSIMNSSTKNEKIFDALIFIKEVEKFLHEAHFLEELKNEFFIFVCESIIYHFQRCNEDFKKAFAKRAKEYILKFDATYFSEEKARILKAKTLNLLNHPEKKTGAALRIKNTLSYKLGQALLDAKSPLKALCLPFTLLRLIKDHRFKLKVLDTLYASHPNLKPPALEYYIDYEEVLEFKEHLSYKLGEALIKSPLTFVFRVSKIYKEFRKRKGRKG